VRTVGAGTGSAARRRNAGRRIRDRSISAEWCGNARPRCSRRTHQN
jgi:hypothetical protein